MRTLLFIALALVAGVVAGYFSVWADYVGAESRLGPFTDETMLTESEIHTFVATGSAEDPEAKPSGRVEVVGPTEFDFGTMRRGAEASHTFRLKNVGDGPLGLEVGGSTCKCTVGSLEESKLEPGETTDVTLTWKARSVGRIFSQSATIKTTDPYYSEVSLKISGRLTDVAHVEPSSWTLGDIRPDEVDQVTAQIYVFEDQPLHIFAADWVDNWLSELSEVEIRDRDLTDADREKYPKAVHAKDVVIRLPDRIRQGPLRETFRIRMGVGETADSVSEDEELLVEVPLDARVIGPVTMLGSTRLRTENDLFRLQIGDTTTGEPLSRSLFVSVRKDAEGIGNLTVASVDPEQALTASLGDPVDSGNSKLYPLKVAIKESARPIERNGTSPEDWGVITLTDSEEKIAPVKLYVTFRVLDLVDAR